MAEALQAILPGTGKYRQFVLPSFGEMSLLVLDLVAVIPNAISSVDIRVSKQYFTPSRCCLSGNWMSGSSG